MWCFGGLDVALGKASSIAVSKVCAGEHLTTANQKMRKEGEMACVKSAPHWTTEWRLRSLIDTFARARGPIHIVNLAQTAAVALSPRCVLFLHHTLIFYLPFYLSGSGRM